MRSRVQFRAISGPGGTARTADSGTFCLIRLGALGGTRTPNLLIRSYRRGPARSKWRRLTRVWAAAQDGHRACGLLYLAAAAPRGAVLYRPRSGQR
jgi:hypothetical protein